MSLFGERVHELRIKKNISQTKLAKELNVDKSSISKWESGDRVPSWDLGKKVAEYFSVSMDYLWGATDNPDQTLPSTFTVLKSQNGILREALAMNKPAELRTIDKVTAVNIMANNYGMTITCNQDSGVFYLSGRKGLYEVSAEELDRILSSVSSEIVEKLMYLEKDKQLELLQNKESF